MTKKATRKPETTRSATRAELTAYLSAHSRTIGKWLPLGLASAITDFGSGSKPMMFDLDLVDRWHRAFRCLQRGVYCFRCRQVMEDATAVAEHLIEVRHGAGGCENCEPPAGGGCQPCAA
jgi:hypothetical protein